LADLRDVFRSVGISGDSVDKIRLGRGVVGKSSYVAVVALAALAVVCTRLSDAHPWFLLFLGLMILVVFCLFLLGVLWFSYRNPGVALLEGSELIQWRQIDLAVKGVVVRSPGPAVSGEAGLELSKGSESAGA
jgi:hypothetical protein